MNQNINANQGINLNQTSDMDQFLDINQCTNTPTFDLLSTLGNEEDTNNWNSYDDLDDIFNENEEASSPGQRRGQKNVGKMRFRYEKKNRVGQFKPQKRVRNDNPIQPPRRWSPRHHATPPPKRWSPRHHSRNNLTHPNQKLSSRQLQFPKRKDPKPTKMKKVIKQKS